MGVPSVAPGPGGAGAGPRATQRDLETAAITMFLYGRMIGAAAEIDDHLNRGRNLDTRPPEAQCARMCCNAAGIRPGGESRQQPTGVAAL
jgi:hypothetical protein